MPDTYHIKLSDGREFNVTTEGGPPSEADVLSSLQGQDSTTPPVERGGLRHPLTSVVQPELEAARGAVRGMLKVPGGTPVMARSRTGALYPSETGTGAINAAKSFGAGLSEGAIDQAEGATSPLAILAGGLTLVPGARQAAASGLRAGGEALESPHSLTRQARTVAGRLMKSVADRIAPQAATEASAASEALPQLPAPPPADTSVLSSAERSGLARQNYDPATIARIEEQLRRGQTSEAAAPELQRPRVARGAEQVGREVGLTKEQVRQQTAPILGEAQGEASPIFPQDVLNRIVDTLKALPPGGSEREAYVRAATSGKAQWQVENIRRTLERLGLLVPAAVAAQAGQRQEQE